jgi:hypothetical protein
MILGLPPFTLIHTLISLLGIASGFVVMFLVFLKGRDLPQWTAFFLATTSLTSITGFFLPASHFMPSHAVGLLSLVILGGALFALYRQNLVGGWRRVYVITAVAAQYLNVFVLVAQLFAKVPSLKALAPTQTETPFKLAQGLVLIAFVLVGALCVRRFHAAMRSGSNRTA